MARFRFVPAFLTLVVAASLTLSCGANQGQSQLQSVTVSPASADARDYPDGEVPFVATGYYINPTRTVTPVQATWMACQLDEPTTEASVSNSGVAQCASGAAGSYSINAMDYTGTNPCPAIVVCKFMAIAGCTVVGTAQLTCP